MRPMLEIDMLQQMLSQSQRRSVGDILRASAQWLCQALSADARCRPQTVPEQDMGESKFVNIICLDELSAK